jgi:hypothetical protein
VEATDGNLGRAYAADQPASLTRPVKNGARIRRRTPGGQARLHAAEKIRWTICEFVHRCALKQNIEGLPSSSDTSTVSLIALMEKLFAN